jgi:hypothetical protein
MEHKNLVIGLICIIAITGTLVFGFYHSASSKIISAKYDNSKRVCQVQNETSYFGGFSPHYYYSPSSEGESGISNTGAGGGDIGSGSSSGSADGEGGGE